MLDISFPTCENAAKSKLLFLTKFFHPFRQRLFRYPVKNIPNMRRGFIMMATSWLLIAASVDVYQAGIGSGYWIGQFSINWGREFLLNLRARLSWGRWVTIPLLREYESVAVYKSDRVELFMPKGRTYQCP